MHRCGEGEAETGPDARTRDYVEARDRLNRHLLEDRRRRVLAAIWTGPEDLVTVDRRDGAEGSRHGR